MLEILLRRSGNVAPKRLFEDHLFGLSGDVGSNAVEVYVHRLRKMLADAGATVKIHTVRGVGYLMAEEKAEVTRFRSIISRVVALHVVAIGVTSILMPLALYWLLDEAANSLHRDALRSQAVTIGELPAAAARRRVALDIPPEVQPLYSGSYGLYAYAVLDTAGRVLFSSRSDGAALFPPGRAAVGDWFDAPAQHGRGAVRRQRARGRSATACTSIQVGQDLAHRDVIIDDIVASFFPRVAWITFPILLVLLLIDILIFRRALEPVREASTTAAAIGPQRTEVRLPEQSMPTEIVPLVHAVNQALDRLEAGFRAQRDFTADMAHELRTPLAIMRARVDSLEPGPLRDALRADLVNMTRTVNQVLDIAELESFVVAADATADLHAVCADAVAFMAPARRRAVARPSRSPAAEGRSGCAAIPRRCSAPCAT